MEPLASVVNLTCSLDDDLNVCLALYISQNKVWKNLSDLEVFKDNLKQPEGHLGATSVFSGLSVFVEAPAHPVWDAER